MGSEYGDFIRNRRAILGLTQRALAAKAGMKQPLVAAIESGRREPSESVRVALARALVLRPSTALAVRRDQVREAFTNAGLPQPQVFGSVARGQDTPDSDLDLLVEFTDEHDIVDLLSLEDHLRALLTVKVDVVDSRSTGRVNEHASIEAVPL